MKIKLPQWGFGDWLPRAFGLSFGLTVAGGVVYSLGAFIILGLVAAGLLPDDLPPAVEAVDAYAGYGLLGLAAISGALLSATIICIPVAAAYRWWDARRPQESFEDHRIRTGWSAYRRRQEGELKAMADEGRPIWTPTDRP